MKNTLKVIVALIIFIIGIIIIDALFVKDEEKELEKNELTEFEMTFLINSKIGEYELIEFNEEERKIIARELSNLDYTKEDIQLIYLGDYKLVFDEKKLVFDDNNDPYGEIFVDGDVYTINIGSLKKTILKYVENKNILKVYLYKKDDESLKYERINLSIDDKQEIKEAVDTIRVLEQEEMIDLAFFDKYILIVDNEEISFDNLNGYALLNNEMVLLEQKMLDVLNSYVSDHTDYIEEDCCSCCPDAEPGEACISACCACTEGGIINAE